MGYYIRYSTHQDGPHDLVSMIRKIRQRRLPPEALVMEENETHAQPARQHPNLNPYFRELDEDYISDEAHDVVQMLDFSALLRFGWDFFRNNLHISLASGLFLLASTLYSIIIFTLAKGSLLPSLLLSGIAISFFLCGFIYLLLQLYRAQPLTLDSVLGFYQQHWNNIALFSLSYCGLILSGLTLFIIPGLLLLAYTAFAPFLVVERNEHFWQAIETSIRTVRRHGTRLSSILIGIVGINVVAALCFGFPLIITLPVTFVGLLELYHRLDFK